jgi:hypothetical protein
MRRQPARTTKSKSRQEDFYEIKDKAQSRRKENKVELEINMERMGSKIIELHKISRNSRTMSSWIISVTTFNRENALESSGKMERENQPFKFID